MRDLIVNNYKYIIGIIVALLLVPVLPTLIEIIFKLGNILGSYIRLVGNGVCL